MEMTNPLMYPSIFWLQKRISKWFEENYNISPAFPGYRCDLTWPSEKVTDVVLFGDAAYSLCLTQWWPRRTDYRIWVLNESLKYGLMKIFKLKESEIGVIPREALLKRVSSERNFPKVLGQINMIYSARKKKVKNFDLTCYLVSYLQTKYFGEYLKLIMYAPRRTKGQLQYRIPDLKWTARPKIMGDKGINWIKTVPKNAIYLNLNVDPLDDFGVSCAQAQEKGFPLILSDRGPYRDIVSDAVIKIPVEMLKLKRKKSELLKQAEEVGDFIMANWFSVKTESRSFSVALPEVISGTRILAIKKYLSDELKKDLKMYPIEETIWDKKLYRLTEKLE